MTREKLSRPAILTVEHQAQKNRKSHWMIGSGQQQDWPCVSIVQNTWWCQHRRRSIWSSTRSADFLYSSKSVVLITRTVFGNNHRHAVWLHQHRHRRQQSHRSLGCTSEGCEHYVSGSVWSSKNAWNSDRIIGRKTRIIGGIVCDTEKFTGTGIA